MPNQAQHVFREIKTIISIEYNSGTKLSGRFHVVFQKIVIVKMLSLEIAPGMWDK